MHWKNKKQKFPKPQFKLTMQALSSLHLTVLICFCLTGCVTVPMIPDRPLSAEEQRMVGTWRTSVEVRRPGNAWNSEDSVVIQLYPDRTSRTIVQVSLHGQQILRRRWSFIGGELRETSGIFVMPNQCGFINNDTLRVTEASGRSSVWKRFSYNPDADANQAMQAERSLGLGAYLLGQGGQSSSSQQPTEDPLLKMGVDYVTKGIVPEGWAKREPPRCERCGAVIVDSVFTASRFCSTHRGLGGNGN